MFLRPSGACKQVRVEPEMPSCRLHTPTVPPFNAFTYDHVLDGREFGCPWVMWWAVLLLVSADCSRSEVGRHPW